jgi:hypothetical protein
LLAFSAAIAAVVVFTEAFRKSKFIFALGSIGMVLALFCFAAGCFFIWIGLQEFYYLYLD